MSAQPLPRCSTASGWEAATCAEMVTYVMARFHTPQRVQLQTLLRLARTVESQQPADSPYPFGLADHVAAMAQELESHMRKEEQVLFPLLLQGDAAEAQAPIAVMLLEHREHGEELQRLDELTSGLQPPPQAGAAWRALYVQLHDFGRDLRSHVHFENNTLFPRAAR